jgi:hypothetical protein
MAARIQRDHEQWRFVSGCLLGDPAFGFQPPESSGTLIFESAPSSE